jgi:hypothetical protein
MDGQYSLGPSADVPSEQDAPLAKQGFITRAKAIQKRLNPYIARYTWGGRGKDASESTTSLSSDLRIGYNWI